MTRIASLPRLTRPYPFFLLIAILDCLSLFNLLVLSQSPFFKVAWLPSHQPLSMELLAFDKVVSAQGSMTALVQNDTVQQIEVTIEATASAKPVRLDTRKLKLAYRDTRQQIDDLPWRWRYQGENNQDAILDPGEQIQIVVPIHSALPLSLEVNRSFVLEIIPPSGAILSLTGKVPLQPDVVSLLN